MNRITAVHANHLISTVVASSGRSRISGNGWRVAEGHEGVGRGEGVSPPYWGEVWRAVPLPQKSFEI